MATPFEHSPLDPADSRAFRVLELLPSLDLKGPIHCKLQHCNLDQDIRYEALSYAWEQPAPGYHVIVNGSSTLDVTPSCIEALMHLRQRFHRRTLWVDAICINQLEDDTSKRERNHQVRFMFEIYRKAKKVIVWLGPADPSTARTIMTLKVLAKVNASIERKSSTDGGNSTSSTSVSHISRVAKLRSSTAKHLANSMFEKKGPRPLYQALASMMRNPWWQRVWTLQEQVLANQCEVHHGRQSISMIDLMCPLLWQKYEFLTEGNFHFNHHARVRTHVSCRIVDDLGRIQPPSPTIPSLIGYLNDEISEHLLHAAFLLQAKNPVDKIYGLYGVLTTYCALPIPVPDYNKTAEDVYEETAWAWISRRNDLSILKLAVRPDHAHKLPSWVPAWHGEHPNFITTNTPPSSSLGNPERYVAFSVGHFSWNYMSRYDMRSAAWREVQEFGPIATLLSSGKLCVLRARYVGKVSHAIGIDKPSDYFFDRSKRFLHMHLRWCRLVHDMFSHSTPKYEEALDEMFRSLQVPGIYEHINEDSQNVDKAAKMFQSWFDFMLYTDKTSRSPNSTSLPIHDADITYRTAITHEKGVGLYMDLVQAEQAEEVISVLEKHYDGNVKGRESLTELARDVQKTHLDLMRVRNHALCILDNDNMMAVANYWCREGDEIFMFPNTDCPFVLRREPDKVSYRLVGPALVDRLYRVGYQKWRVGADDLQDITLV